MTFKTIALVMVVMLLLGTAIVIGVSFFVKDPFFQSYRYEEESVQEIVQNHTAFELHSKDKDGNKLYADYILKEENIKIAHGKLDPFILETFNEVKENITYNLFTWSNDYYLSRSKCNNTIDKCQTQNTKVGQMSLELEEKEPNLYAMTIKVNNGSIRKPTICVAWSINILYVRSSMKTIDVPRTFKQDYDMCFQEDSIIAEDRTYDLKVYFYADPQMDNLKLLLMDKVEIIDNRGILREEYLLDGVDVGTRNVEKEIVFT